MRTKNRQVKFYVTPEEHDALRENARKSGMTVSDYIRRSLIYSDDCTVRVIDTGPLREALVELNRHGNNLNQFVRILNTYGGDALDAEAAERVLREEGETFRDIRAALVSLRRAAERQGVALDVLPNGSGGDAS